MSARLAEPEVAPTPDLEQFRPCRIASLLRVHAQVREQLEALKLKPTSPTDRSETSGSWSKAVSMENVNLKAVQIAYGAVAAAALIFGLIPVSYTYRGSSCGSVFFKSDGAQFCGDQYPVSGGLLLAIILVAAAVCIYATVANNATND